MINLSTKNIMFFLLDFCTPIDQFLMRNHFLVLHKMVSSKLSLFSSQSFFSYIYRHLVNKRNRLLTLSGDEIVIGSKNFMTDSSQLITL